MRNRLIQIFFISFVFIASSNAQFGVPLNDNCDQSFRLTDLVNFCSEISGDFSTTGATEEIVQIDGCINSFIPEGVWYNFIAITNYVRITIEGEGDGLNLSAPLLGFYEGNCGSLTELNCVNAGTGENIIELVRDVVPGRRYFLLVGSTLPVTGNFRLCINSFNNDPEPLQDCGNARILCDKSPIGVESVVGFGNQKDNLNLSANPAVQFPACGVEEDASNWYKWTCDEAGTLTFTITPVKEYDDIDFIVYEFPDGLDNCSTMVPVRTLISGQNLGAPFNQWAVCVGPTGLQAGDQDLGESCGCQNGDNNFGAALNMEAGKSYGLMVMNFSQSGVGYNLEWGGTGTFLGPIPEFSVEPITGLRCDQDFIIEDRTQGYGNPLEYSWYFGEGATPEFADEGGPFQVSYDSYGEKYIVLNVTDPVNGCSVTEIFDVFAEPCCEDLQDVEGDIVQLNDPSCPGYADGSFELAANGGSGVGYTFSINGSPYVNGSTFGNLPAGTFTINVIDSKGCEGSINVNLMNPDSIILDAGLDSVVDLGESIELLGQVIRDNGRDYIITWDPSTDNTTLSCLDCLDPNVTPAGNTVFTLIATDELGCVFSDRVTIEVDPNYPIYIPNVFSPNQDGYNDNFTAYGGIAIDYIVELKIFDRWGNLVYVGKNFLPNDPTSGWDGLYNGRQLQAGVYTYMFDVQFIDNGPPRKFTGDITLLK